MAKEDSDNKNSNDQFAAAQLEKLRLEIEEMKSRRTWWHKVARFTPVTTALIAVAGFSFTVNQFLVQQKKDTATRELEQAIRDETQIRVDITQLLDLAGTQNKATASIVFLLEDLRTLTDRRASEKPKVTSAIIKFLTDDCDFDLARHAQTDAAAMTGWNDYRAYLADNPVINRNMIYKYLQSLRHVHDEDKPYFEQMQYQVGSEYRVPYYTEESRYTRYLSLVAGFSGHVKIIQNESEERQGAIQKFAEALNNQILTAQLIEAKILPRP